MLNEHRKSQEKKPRNKRLTLLIVSQSFQESLIYLEFRKTDSGRKEKMDKSIICYFKLFEGLNADLILKACGDYTQPVTKCLSCVDSHTEGTEFLR